MGKSKLSAEEKLKWIKKYLNGEKSYAAISRECCVAESTLRRWVNNYTTQWIVALPLKRTNYHINPRIAKFKVKFAA